MSQNAFKFWIRSVIDYTYASSFKEDCRFLRVKASEVWKVATSSLFRRNCAIHEVLKAGTWS